MQNKRVPSFGKKVKQQSLKLKCHVNFMKLENWKERKDTCAVMRMLATIHL